MIVAPQSMLLPRSPDRRGHKEGESRKREEKFDSAFDALVRLSVSERMMRSEMLNLRNV